MSSTVITVWEKGETEKIKIWFSKVGNQYEEIFVPEFPYIEGLIICPYRQNVERGIWVIFEKNKIDFDTAIWDDIGGAYATIIVQELSKKFKLKKAGWDSIGYCTEDFMNSEGLLVRIYRDRSELKKDVERMDEINKILREEAIKLVELR